MYVLAKAISDAGKDLTTPRLIDALENMHDYRVGPIASPRTFTKNPSHRQSAPAADAGEERRMGASAVGEQAAERHSATLSLMGRRRSAASAQHRLTRAAHDLADRVAARFVGTQRRQHLRARRSGAGNSVQGEPGLEFRPRRDRDARRLYRAGAHVLRLPYPAMVPATLSSPRYSAW